MVDPTDHTALAKVGYSIGHIVKPLVVPEFRMIQLLKDHYGVDERWRFNDTRRGAEAPRLDPLRIRRRPPSVWTRPIRGTRSWMRSSLCATGSSSA